MKVADVVAIMPSNVIVSERTVVERRGNWVDGASLWESFSTTTPTRCVEYVESGDGNRMARVYFDADGVIVGWYFSAE
jgi:hypothetical protein